MRTSVSRFTNPSVQSVDANGTILFTNNTFSNKFYRYNSNGTINFLIPGIYEIITSFTITSTGSTSTVTLTMNKNGNASNTAKGGETMAASGDLANISIIDIVEINPSSSGTLANINFQSSAATSISNAVCIIKRVG